MRAAGVALVVPLVANGELVGLLNVGRRLSDQDYSADDRRLLETLAAQAAPAVRVGQLVREQQAEIRARDRLEQELAVAQLIQQNFLPKELPALDGWELAAFYRPARAVGGDFYDFIELGDGRIGLVIGDVTDKGDPGRDGDGRDEERLRASAQRLAEPGAVLARVNDSLCPDIPENMFVTCFYGVLNPATGHLRYANAGHNLPLVNADGAASELRATGMPLGLMRRDRATRSARRRSTPHACVLLYSDGLVEAHDADARDVRQRSRRRRARAGAGDAQHGDRPPAGRARRLHRPGRRAGGRHHARRRCAARSCARHRRARRLPRRERAGQRARRDATRHRGGRATRCPADRLERLRTATAEATMNAMEHGNRYDPDLFVHVQVAATDDELTVRIVDHGGDREIAPAPLPDIDAKLDGRQSPRGWGLFLIQQHGRRAAPGQRRLAPHGRAHHAPGRRQR